MRTALALNFNRCSVFDVQCSGKSVACPWDMAADLNSSPLNSELLTPALEHPVRQNVEEIRHAQAGPERLGRPQRSLSSLCGKAASELTRARGRAA